MIYKIKEKNFAKKTAKLLIFLGYKSIKSIFVFIKYERYVFKISVFRFRTKYS